MITKEDLDHAFIAGATMKSWVPRLTAEQLQHASNVYVQGRLLIIEARDKEAGTCPNYPCCPCDSRKECQNGHS